MSLRLKSTVTKKKVAKGGKGKGDKTKAKPKGSVGEAEDGDHERDNRHGDRGRDRDRDRDRAQQERDRDRDRDRAREHSARSDRTVVSVTGNSEHSRTPRGDQDRRHTQLALRRVGGPTVPDKVTISQVELDHLLDITERSASNAKAAAKIAKGFEEAFSQSATSLEDCAAFFRRYKRAI